jgi:peptidoglycan/LPS O-acetylase OafA/YrhL
MMMSARTLQAAIGTRHNNFNAVRLLLASLVVLFHAYAVGQRTDPLSALLQPHMHIGQLAVGTFFLLSGIFVMQSWLKDPRTWAFLVRRVARVLPGLAVCVTLTALLAVSFFSPQGVGGLFAADTWHYITSNTFLHYLKSDIQPNQLVIPGVFSQLPDPAMNGSLWSLYWEGKFYVLLALMGLLAMNRSPYWFTALAGLLIVLLPGRSEMVRDYLWEFPLLTIFLVGVVLQTIAQFLTVRWQHVVAAAIFFYLTRWGSVPFSIYLVCGVAALWLGSHNWQVAGHLQRHDYSYSVYIYHWPILQMLKSLFPEMNSIFLFLCCGAVLAPVAMLSWTLVEKPGIRFGHSLCRRFSRSAAVPAPR